MLKIWWKKSWWLTDSFLANFKTESERIKRKTYSDGRVHHALKGRGKRKWVPIYICSSNCKYSVDVKVGEDDECVRDDELSDESIAFVYIIYAKVIENIPESL